MLLAPIGVIAVLALPAAAQQPPDQVPTTGTSMTVDAMVGGIVTLLVGGGLIAVTPEFTERTTDRVLAEPGETFLYGLGIFVAAVVLVILLAITIVGLVLAIPLILALAVVGQVGYLAAGRAVADEWGVVLLVAVVVSAFASGVPVLGGLVGFVLSCFGFGAWYLDYRDDSGGGTGQQTAHAGGSNSGSSADVTDEWGAGSRPTGTGGDDDRGSPDGGGTDAGADAGDGAADDTDDGDPWTSGFDDGRE